MAVRITDELVKSLTPPEAGNKITYDNVVRGFGVRITKAGTRAFVLNYRVAGRERRIKIGRYPDWSVEKARKQAKSYKQDVDRDIDPLGKRQAERAAPTVGDLCDRYITDHLPDKRESSARDDKAMIKNIIRPKLGSDKVAAIEQGQLVKLHRSLVSTPYRANRVLALVSKMLELAISWKMRPDNPAKGIKKFPEIKRERFLSADEIKALVKALDEYKDQTAANIVRLLLLTGARTGEVRSMQWSQLDLDSGVWVKPAATTKQAKLHRVPLSDGAVALLKSIHLAAPRNEEGNLESEYLFPGPISEKPIAEIKDEWADIATNAGIYGPGTAKHCRLHDLRHTYASLLVSRGLSLPIIGQLLGHTQVATTARYSHLFDDPLRKATNLVSNVISGKPSGKIVKLQKRAKR
jgi:integrase